MGVWGSGLYDNDCTCDIRDAFQNLLAQGTHPKQIGKVIREDFGPVFSDDEEGPLAELALCEQLLQTGVITNKEIASVLAFLNNGGDLERWNSENPQLAPEREIELSRLKLLFLSPIPKVIGKSNKQASSKFNWCKDQVFAIPIVNTEVCDLQGEFFLLHICGEEKKTGRYRIPKMRVKITNSKKLPRNADEFNSLDYVQISCTSMKNRLLPFYREDAIPDEFKQEYYPDRWGYLPEFTFLAYEYTDIHPPKTMTYLGKWENILPPDYDFRRYPFPEGVAWDYFEEFVIQRFHLHNLRQAEFYK